MTWIAAAPRATSRRSDARAAVTLLEAVDRPRPSLIPDPRCPSATRARRDLERRRRGTRLRGPRRHLEGRDAHRRRLRAPRHLLERRLLDLHRRHEPNVVHRHSPTGSRFTTRLAGRHATPTDDGESRYYRRVPTTKTFPVRFEQPAAGTHTDAVARDV